tara:strand:+ start:3601 stop:4221 length:621 start_codon:yes stop_codon:yes gene_type:complete
MPTKKQLAQLLEDVMVASDNITHHNMAGPDDYVHDTFILIDQAEYDAITTAAAYIREQYEGEVEHQIDKIDKMKEENEKLKAENKELTDRLSIMSATASEHINDINDTHQKYGDMVRKLQEQLKKGGKAHMKDKKAYDTNLKIRDEEIEKLKAEEEEDEEDYRVYGEEWKKEQKEKKEELYKVVESTVNMDAFQKLKDDGMMPWVK